MKHTQEEIYYSHTSRIYPSIFRLYTCPECKSEHCGEVIENEDEPEELPQVHCGYGCGYIYLTYKES